jgi:hypothetical protein
MYFLFHFFSSAYSINHFSESCRHLGQDTREKLARLKERKSYKLGGGKGYWATGARIRHVCEVDNRLYFEDKKPAAAATAATTSDNNAKNKNNSNKSISKNNNKSSTT